ncbi:hypothetical protein PO909_002499 [Leuciscus waleckii]
MRTVAGNIDPARGSGRVESGLGLGQRIKALAKGHLICDLTLMEGFWCGLDDEIRLVMLRGYPVWTLESYVNFALCIDGSSFIVGRTEEDVIVQSHLTPVRKPSSLIWFSLEPPFKMAADVPEPRPFMAAAVPESRPVETTLPESCPVKTTPPESRPVGTTFPESRPIKTALLELLHVRLAEPEPLHVRPAQPETFHVMRLYVVRKFVQHFVRWKSVYSSA